MDFGTKIIKLIFRLWALMQELKLSLCQNFIAIRSSSYNAMINMIIKPKSKPKFCSMNVTRGYACNASLCIRSGSCIENNITVLTDRIKPKTTLFCHKLCTIQLLLIRATIKETQHVLSHIYAVLVLNLNRVKMSVNSQF